MGRVVWNPIRKSPSSKLLMKGKGLPSNGMMGKKDVFLSPWADLLILFTWDLIFETTCRALGSWNTDHRQVPSNLTVCVCVCVCVGAYVFQWIQRIGFRITILAFRNDFVVVIYFQSIHRTWYQFSVLSSFVGWMSVRIGNLAVSCLFTASAPPAQEEEDSAEPLDQAGKVSY